jgi:hypothetical protein
MMASNSYFSCDSCLIVLFKLAFPIGSFKRPEPAAPVAEDPKKKDSKAPAGKDKQPSVPAIDPD